MYIAMNNLMIKNNISIICKEVNLAIAVIIIDLFCLTVWREIRQRQIKGFYFTFIAMNLSRR